MPVQSTACWNSPSVMQRRGWATRHGLLTIRSRRMNRRACSRRAGGYRSARSSRSGAPKRRRTRLRVSSDGVHAILRLPRIFNQRTCSSMRCEGGSTPGRAFESTCSTCPKNCVRPRKHSIRTKKLAAGASHNRGSHVVARAASAMSATRCQISVVCENVGRARSIGAEKTRFRHSRRHAFIFLANCYAYATWRASSAFLPPFLIAPTRRALPPSHTQLSASACRSPAL